MITIYFYHLVVSTAVQHERAPRNNSKTKFRPNEFSPYPPQVVTPYFRVPIMPSDIELPVSASANVPLERITPVQPHTPVPVPVQQQPKQNIVIQTPSELYEVCARILYEAITWARNIPTFSQLPLDDQALLLEYSWSEIFLLNLAQLNVPLAMETMIKLTQQNKEYQNDKSDIDKETLNELVHIQSVVFKLKTLNMTSSEYSCVKAVILFKPGKVAVTTIKKSLRLIYFILRSQKMSIKTSISHVIDLVRLPSKSKTFYRLCMRLFSIIKPHFFITFIFTDLRRIKSRQHVENLQEQAQLRLHDSVMIKGPRSRFGKILLKLSLLGEVSPSFIERCFFKGGLENISEDFNNGPSPSTKSTIDKTNSQSNHSTSPTDQSKDSNDSPMNQSEESSTLHTPAVDQLKKSKQTEISQSEDDGVSANQSKESVDDLIISSIKQEEVEDMIEIVI